MCGTVAQSHLSPPATSHYTGGVGIVTVVASISFPWEITIPLIHFHFSDSICILCFMDHQIQFIFSVWFAFHKDHISLLRIQVWNVYCRVDENLHKFEKISGCINNGNGYTIAEGYQKNF